MSNRGNTRIVDIARAFEKYSPGRVIAKYYRWGQKGLWIFTTKNRTAATDNNFDGMMCYDENTGEFRSFNPFDDDPNGHLSNIIMNKYK